MKDELMRYGDLRKRTKDFALLVIRFYMRQPKTALGQVLGRQILKSGTSPGAHYREAYRSRSDAEFISKIEGALQELDETTYWLELIVDAGIAPSEQEADELKAEANELISIFVTSVKSTKARSGRT